MKSHTGKASEEAKEPAAAMSEMTETLRENCEQALRTSLKLQEEAGRWWNSVLNPGNCAEQWQEQFNTTARKVNTLLPLAQKPISELIDLAEKNSRTSAELLKKMAQAIQTPTPGESQAKWTELWNTSLKALQANAEAVSQIGTKALDSWAGFVKENGQPLEGRGFKAAA